jgi:hypothetical protein
VADDGELDPLEVDDTQHVCNGDTGATGTVEPPFQAFQSAAASSVFDGNPVPFSNTSVGASTADIVPDYITESFAVVTPGNYQIDWTVNVLSFTGLNFAVGLEVSGSLAAGSRVTTSSEGETSGSVSVALQEDDVIRLVNDTTPGAGFAPVETSGVNSFLIYGTPSVGATIRFQRLP